jgi:hypothetical protein
MNEQRKVSVEQPVQGPAQSEIIEEHVDRKGGLFWTSRPARPNDSAREPVRGAKSKPEGGA